MGTRDHLLAALEADLVGPYDASVPEEILKIPPSRWYLTGFLASQAARDENVTDDGELGIGTEEDEDETPGEPEPKQKSRLPASMGLSVLLPPGAGDEISATVEWAEYVALEGEDKRQRPRWRRVPHAPVTVRLPLDGASISRGCELPGTEGVWVGGKLGVAEAPGLPGGTRALALFVVNRREPGEQGREDEQHLFQVSLRLDYEAGFVARPNRRDESAEDWDDRVSDLQYRDRTEHAVGHGVAVKVPAHRGAGGTVTEVSTTWLPRAEVRNVSTRTEARVETRMQALAELPDASAALGGLATAYGAWIAAQRVREVGSDTRRATRDELCQQADDACRRIAAGVELLARDADVRLAFQLANRAMAEAARRRRPDVEPSWRPFQLAFVLLNLGALAAARHPDREIVDLIFFPTGGGKTEAYLGLIAFLLVLRRLRGQARPDRGLGVAVLLRYTLRLLTLDQLGRAATLICALERLRQADPERLGPVRFSVGLWVGRSATANTLAEVAEKVTLYRNNRAQSPTSPCPLTHCPWCGKPLGPDSLTLHPVKSPTEVVVACLDRRCDFSASKNHEGLPVLFVDEQIYRELPSFLVATVDKFAMLPWRGETGMLFGRVQGREGRRFHGPMDKLPRLVERLPEGLRPPELIVQDELHLISGPLGTMVGLYETAIEALCTDRDGTRPKIIASTATVRRAREQIRALFGRQQMALFPPPGVDDSDNFFAHTDTGSEGRLYVGVAASGRAMKAILLRTYVALLGAASKVGDDGYQTLVGYFNSLRELGGMRRLVEDEVRGRCAALELRRPTNVDASRWFANRTLQLEPLELTSREHTAKIAEAKARLARPHSAKEHVDVVLASNMISVGVDIDRLGLMVVAGQPKTTSEYIQASSRVGRAREWPGLVVTCFNLHRPRDRSHYERFETYHQSFYRFVEATSLTPFSGPALERGLAGALVAMVRLLLPAMTPPEGAMAIAAHRAVAEEAVARLAERGAVQPGVDGSRHDRVRETLVGRGRNLLDAWERLVVEAAQEAAARRSYSRFDRDRAAGKPLLYQVLDEDRPDARSEDAKFAAPTSMRDVEPTVSLWMERDSLGGAK